MRALLVLTATLLPAHLWAQPQTLIEWTFDTPGDTQGWVAANHIDDLRAEDGALQGRIMDWDPFTRGPQFEIAASPWQRVDIRLRTDVGGDAELFWTNTTDSPYGGFSPGKETHFSVVGDGEWHEYQVFPFWHKEGKIILLRLDLPRPADADMGKKTFAVDWIRIVDLGTPTGRTTDPTWDFSQALHGWSPSRGASVEATAEGMQCRNGDSADAFVMSPPLDCPLEAHLWASVEMKLDRGQAAYIRWVSSDHNGWFQAKIPVRADGQFHTYNIDLSSEKTWTGSAIALGLTPSNAPGATAVVRRLTLAEDPQGPPDVECTYVGLEDAITRAGNRMSLILRLSNRGGETAGDLQIADLQLPAGVSVAQEGDWRTLAPVEPFIDEDHRIFLQADEPVRGEARVVFSGRGAPAEPAAGPVVIEPGLNLPRADYVPEPRPAETDYEIGAFYFPGWSTADRWAPIRRVAPERKPVLGWYDEANPECADWQIKWAVEHGISFFMVDWYWSAGSRHLEHWLHDAYMNARYRKYLKWCVMWANHNAPDTHSEEDQREVTRYWIDNYFGMDEYYRIDDRPVVMIWSPGNMRRDMGGTEGAKRLLDISQEMAKAAGYKGITFIAMGDPLDPKPLQVLKDEGYEMTSQYHYMEHMGLAEDPRHYPFELVARTSYDWWTKRLEANVLPSLLNMATGWDDRPWHGDRGIVVYGRTVPLFRKICEDARRFADENEIKILGLAPLNEWGEGSYLEPCKEFGFEMYETLRDVFCREPAEGWPPNIAPADVGLGPYDLPEVRRELRTAWDFGDGMQGWGALMGVTRLRVEEGALHFTTTSRDPAVGVSLSRVAADQFPYVIVRMRVENLQKDDQAQLFWAGVTSPISEVNSVRFDLVNDGQYHTYVLPVGDNPRWRGRLQSLRFDPCGAEGVRVSIEQVRLSETAQ